MDMVNGWSRQGDDGRGKIFIVAAAIIGLMVLFPPKVVVRHVPLLGQVTTESAGYQFILSDPAGGAKAALQGAPDELTNEMFAGSGVAYGKLLIQIVVVIGATAAALWFTSASRRGGTLPAS